MAESLQVNRSTQVVYVSEETCLIFRWAVLVAAGIAVNTFGAVTNIINIICFVKQGYTESVNVNFLGLAISDLGSLITMLMTCIGYIPTFEDLVLSYHFLELIYLTAAWPHIVFARVSSWITALITLERCLCITMPLKVKLFFTPQRVSNVIACLYLIIIGSVSPVYYANSYGWKFSPERNITILGLVFAQERDAVEHVAFALNNAVIPFSAFIVVFVCTVVLVINLSKKSKWRKKSTCAGQARAANHRDQKISKMIVVIAVFFISSYVPVCFTFIAIMLIPGLSIDGHNKNTLFVCGGISVFLESTNSAVNIFVYYQMSSKYRCAFLELFKFRSNEKFAKA